MAGMCARSDKDNIPVVSRQAPDELIHEESKPTPGAWPEAYRKSKNNAASHGLLDTGSTTTLTIRHIRGCLPTCKNADFTGKVPAAGAGWFALSGAFR